MNTEPLGNEELAHWRYVGEQGSSAGECAGIDLRRMVATIDVLRAEVERLTTTLERYKAQEPQRVERFARLMANHAHTLAPLPREEEE